MILLPFFPGSIGGVGSTGTIGLTFPVSLIIGSLIRKQQLENIV
jgi:hypothetical protein